MEYTNSQIRELIAEHIHSSRDRYVLELRLIDGLTYEKISEIVDMSPRQIKNIIYKNEEILFSKLP